MENKVVAHLKDGRIHKGITHDFEPEESAFHLLPAEGGGVPIKLELEEMKALFYVRDYLGNREFVARRRFDEDEGEGRKVIVTFVDGEVVFGRSRKSDERPGGFFMVPVDPDDNNVRMFVVRSFIRTIQFPD